MEYGRNIPAGLGMAALAHDLRTPMCVAAGAAQMALDAGGKDVSQQLHQILQAVGAMDRMLSMMSDLPEEAGCRVFTAEMLREELLVMTADKAECKGQRLSIDLSAIEGLMMEADYAALCRLLTNLLGNAVKYTQEGGMITLCAWPERSLMRPGHMRVRFVVSDNGMGMTRAFMRRMFQPFVRAREAEKIAGSGLGLSIARDMAARLEAAIRVYSERGKGTTFIVYVPVCVHTQRRTC